MAAIILLTGTIIFGVLFFFFTRRYPRKETQDKKS